MKAKTVFFCTECGNQTPKWQGRCSACGAWNTIVEQPKEDRRLGSRSTATMKASGTGPNTPRKLSKIKAKEEMRFRTEFSELDRVLGGGAVRGSLVLVGGEPGIGKSTLMLQICASLTKSATVLYVSGEESEQQLKIRVERLHVESDELYFFAENNLETLMDSVHHAKPDILIVDSIQTLYHGEINASPGSISQINRC